jgi:hypothetical protein
MEHVARGKERTPPNSGANQTAPEVLQFTRLTGAAGVNKVAVARQRHGKPFAYESGSNWKPRPVPLLTEWLQSRGREVK